VKTERLPDVVLVKKVYGDKSERNRKRRWRLKRLAAGIDDDGGPVSAAKTAADEMNEFMEDLEEDTDLRRHVNVYKKQGQNTDARSVSDGDGAPQIDLADMLDDLELAGDSADMDE